MANSHLTDFYSICSDAGRLAAAKRAGNITKEADVIQDFYDACESIIKKSDLDIHEARLTALNSHVKAKILEKELKEVYNEIFKRSPGLAAELIARSAMPTKKELEQQVVIK